MSWPKIHVERAAGAERTGYGKYGFELEKALGRLGHLDAESSLRLIVAPSYALKRKRKGEEVWCALMFEASRLPESFLEVIDSYAGLIVPNEYNLEQFRKEHANVHLAPLGIDPDVWMPIVREPGEEFRVFFFGKSPRKGMDLAPQIFEKAFPDAAKLSPKPVFIHDRVGGMYTEQEMVDIVGCADVVLGPSRGEGWNLMPFEALATGCPIVVSDIPGHQPFSHLPGVYLGGAQMIDSWLGGAGTWWAGKWWQPNVEELAVQLRWVYDHHSEALADAFKGAQMIRETMTWKHAAVEVLKAVGDATRPLMEDLPEEDEPLALRRWLVQIIKPVHADIGGTLVSLPVGEASLTADQLRVLTTAGYVAEEGRNFMRTWEPYIK